LHHSRRVHIRATTVRALDRYRSPRARAAANSVHGYDATVVARAALASSSRASRPRHP
jgi:hypothetical protein